mmetsp:Transcript_8386/g.15547  ORF Transcript_8386/g.15547 Transcript_8386/m.15547 type:complete len:243 (+) Transcript_8386:64-792(+)
MTTCSDVVANLDGRGYGARLETPSAHPAILSASMNWRGAMQAKLDMARFNNVAGLIVLTRDSGSGRVFADAKENVRVEYTLNTLDKSHMMKGLEKALNILVAAGAQKVHAIHQGVEPFEPKNTNIADPEYQKWLAKILENGIVPNRTGLFSAHQMGTCKMGVDSSRGAVKPTSETWEADNLFVCDTSVFPTPSGTNPMITVASITYGSSKHVIDKLEALRQKSRNVPTNHLNKKRIRFKSRL